MKLKNRRDTLKLFGIEHQETLGRALPSLAPGEFKVQEYEAKLDKKRWLYDTSEEHLVADKILSLDLAERIGRILPKEVMSFQKGLGPHHVVKDLRDFMGANGNQGLFVIRTDIRSYTDSILVTESSPLWRKLQELNYSAHEIQHLKAILRPAIGADETGGERSRIRGVPTGFALTPVLANLYSIDLDRIAISKPGLFYRRYGDDIILASKDRDLIETTWQEMERTIQTLQLEFHPDKTKKLFWCRNGRSLPSHPDYQGTHFIDLLGYQLQYAKGLRLNQEKMRELRNGFVRNLLTTRDLAMKEPLNTTFEERAHLLIQVANRYFSLDNRSGNGRIADFFQWVDDEGQLRELEDFCARILSQTLAEVRGTRAYSKISWKDLIEVFGWKSPRFQWNRRKSAA
jgi:hypothetical protein